MPVLADVLSLESERQQVASELQALRSILADLNSAVVWTISIPTLPALLFFC